MRYNVKADPASGECVWKADGHAVPFDALAVPADVRERVKAWVGLHAGLAAMPQEEHATFEAWQDYDEQGRRIARLLKPALGPDAAVFYYLEAVEEYERVA